MIETNLHGNSIMLDLDQAKKDISTWILTVLSEPAPELNGISRCPFAAAALANDRVMWITGSNVAVDIREAIASWQPNCEIAVLIYPADIDADDFSQAVESANSEICRPSSFIALEDHPRAVENVAGLIMNQGQHALILVTPAAKLHKASQMLRARGYYTNWTAAELDMVVNWRWSC
jgi:hypothetical protein